MALVGQYSSLLFQPFSYERYLAPLMAEAEAIRSQQDYISDLETTANLLESKLDKTLDKDTYNLYLNYINSLRDTADTLLREGRVLQGSRRQLLNLKSRYSKEIMPINEAILRRIELAKLQQLISLQDPSRIWQDTASLTSIDKYMKDKSFDALSTNYSLKDLTADVTARALALAKEIRTPEGAARVSSITGIPYLKLLLKGFTSEEVLKAIAGDKDADPVLQALVLTAVDSTGISNWSNWDLVQGKTYAAARKGLYYAIGDSVPITDSYGMNSALKAQDHAFLASENAKSRAFQASEAAKGRKFQERMYNKQKKDAENVARALYESNLPINMNTMLIGGDGELAKENFYSTLKTLGLDTMKKDGTLNIGKIKVTVPAYTVITRGDPKIREYVGPTHNNGSKLFDVFNKNGKLLSRSEFLNQGMSLKDREALGKYYDNTILPSIKNIKSGSLYAINIYRDATNYLNNLGAKIYNTIAMNFDDNNKVFKNNISRLIPITGAYDISKDIKSKKTASSTVISQAVKDNNDAVSFDLSSIKGHEGLIISTGDKKYLIPKNNLGSLSRDHWMSIDNLSTYYNLLSLFAEQKDNYSEAELQLMMQLLEAMRTNISIESLRNMITGIAGTYKIPSATVMNNSLN